MIVIHKSEYNPRIDFIVCKQLLCNLPYEYSEPKLRECFGNEAGELAYEKDIIALKNFFKTTDITKATKTEVEVLYGICTHESIKYDGEIGKVDCMDDLERLAETVGEYEYNRVTLFQILMLFGYCRTRGVPIMPYHGICAKIYNFLISGDCETAEKGWAELKYRKSKYSVKHPIEQNAFCIKQIKEYSAEFLKITGVEKLGVYGSLAQGTDTEYSDADILVVIKDGLDVTAVKQQAHKFWADKLPFHYDICVTTEDGMKNLPIGIRSSVKFLGGECDGKKL